MAGTPRIIAYRGHHQWIYSNSICLKDGAHEGFVYDKVIAMSLKSLILLSAAFSVSIASAQQFAEWNGKKMPDFVMTTIKGMHLTTKQLRGKVVLFDFWATWCGPCKMASPAMDQLEKHYRKQGLVVIGADVLENSPGAAGATKYAKEHGYSYTFTYDNNGLAQTLKIDSIPAFALMDRKGTIRWANVGLPPGGAGPLYAYLQPMVEKLLAKHG